MEWLSEPLPPQRTLRVVTTHPSKSVVVLSTAVSCRAARGSEAGATPSAHSCQQLSQNASMNCTEREVSDAGTARHVASNHAAAAHLLVRLDELARSACAQVLERVGARGVRDLPVHVERSVGVGGTRQSSWSSGDPQWFLKTVAYGGNLRISCFRDGVTPPCVHAVSDFTSTTSPRTTPHTLARTAR